MRLGVSAGQTHIVGGPRGTRTHNKERQIWPIIEVHPESRFPRSEGFPELVGDMPDHRRSSHMW